MYFRQRSSLRSPSSTLKTLRFCKKNLKWKVLKFEFLDQPENLRTRWTGIKKNPRENAKFRVSQNTIELFRRVPGPPEVSYTFLASFGVDTTKLSSRSPQFYKITSA
jgi:hypothetical protein